MTLKTYLFAALAVSALAACTPKKPAEEAAPAAEAPAADSATAPEAPAADAPATMADEDACKASEYQSLVGTNAAAVTLPADLPHRILGPNDVATMDYRPDRLNIMTDEAGVVTEVKCG